MTGLTLPIKFILAFVLGMVIGNERQLHEKYTSNEKVAIPSILRLRIFSLISVAGLLVGILYEKYLALDMFIGASCLLQVLIFYILDSRRTKDTGISTEFALLYSFLIGEDLFLPQQRP